MAARPASKCARVAFAARPPCAHRRARAAASAASPPRRARARRSSRGSRPSAVASACAIEVDALERRRPARRTAVVVAATARRPGTPLIRRRRRRGRGRAVDVRGGRRASGRGRSSWDPIGGPIAVALAERSAHEPCSSRPTTSPATSCRAPVTWRRPTCASSKRACASSDGRSSATARPGEVEIEDRFTRRAARDRRGRPTRRLRLSPPGRVGARRRHPYRRLRGAAHDPRGHPRGPAGRAGDRRCAVTRPFRFGVSTGHAPDRSTWQERARLAESVGLRRLAHRRPPRARSVPADDRRAIRGRRHRAPARRHVRAQQRLPAPGARRERSGCDQALTDGRFELGIGAGHMKFEYDQAGITFDDAATRVSRLAEAIEVMRRLWSGEPCTFSGEHYQVTDHQIDATPVPLLVGGNGPRSLRLAAERADIVGFTGFSPNADGSGVRLEQFTSRGLEQRSHSSATPRASASTRSSSTCCCRSYRSRPTDGRRGGRCRPGRARRRRRPRLAVRASRHPRTDGRAAPRASRALRRQLLGDVRRSTGQRADVGHARAGDRDPRRPLTLPPRHGGRLPLPPMAYRYLWTPLRLGPVTVRNRIVFCAHLTNYARGRPADRAARRLLRGARRRRRRADHHRGALDPPDGLAVREADPRLPPRRHPRLPARSPTPCTATGVPIFAQINHNGGQASSMYTPPAGVGAVAGGRPAVPRGAQGGRRTPRSTRSSPATRSVAEHCAEGGFDGIELQCRHSLDRARVPLAGDQPRTDDYGGSLDNRARLLLEIVAAVRGGDRQPASRSACGSAATS